MSSHRMSFLLIMVFVIGHFLMPTSDGRSEEPLVRLSFVKFRIETYLPITTTNIEDHGRTIWFLEKHQFTDDLFNLLQSKPTNRKFDGKLIRLKADFGKTRGVIYVDGHGVVIKHDTKATYELSRKEMEEVEKEISRFYGVVDLTPYRRMTKKQ